MHLLRKENKMKRRKIPCIIYTRNRVRGCFGRTGGERRYIRNFKAHPPFLSLYFLSCYLSFLFFFFFRVTYGGLRGFFSKRGIIKTGVGGCCLCLSDLGEKKVRQSRTFAGVIRWGAPSSILLKKLHAKSGREGAGFAKENKYTYFAECKRTLQT